MVETKSQKLFGPNGFASSGQLCASNERLARLPTAVPSCVVLSVFFSKCAHLWGNDGSTVETKRKQQRCPPPERAVWYVCIKHPWALLNPSSAQSTNKRSLSFSLNANQTRSQAGKQALAICLYGWCATVRLPRKRKENATDLRSAYRLSSSFRISPFLPLFVIMSIIPSNTD